MSLFLKAAGHAVTDPLTLSEVRRQLAAARTGVSAPLVPRDDGWEDREAVSFSVAGVQLETLMGQEAVAALDLLAALHRGEMSTFVAIGSDVYRVAPQYWEEPHKVAADCLADTLCLPAASFALATFDDPTEREQERKRERKAAKRRWLDSARAQKSLQRSALLWGEDEINPREDGQVPAEFVGQPLLLNRPDASNWIAERIRLDSVSASATPTEEARMPESGGTRSRRSTPRGDGLRAFWKFAAGREYPGGLRGEALREAYRTWCSKQRPPVLPYGRSEFFRQLNIIRSESDI